MGDKEVKKRYLLNLVFASIKAGKKSNQIIKELSISKQRLQYYLDKLRLANKIKKIGYGVWQTSKDEVGNSIRGHGFLWHIKLPTPIKNWKEILINKKIDFKEINKGNTLQAYFRDNKLWISRKSIVIFDIESYFSSNAVESKKLAIFKLREYLLSLQQRLGVNLQNKGNFILKTSRQHYALVKNCLAIQCNKEGKKINVYNEKGLWFIIDNSFNFEEAETINKDTAISDSLGIQKYFNEHKETNFQVTPKFILEAINGVTKNQVMFNQNFESHVEAIKKLGDSVIELTNQVKILQEENRRLRDAKMS